MRYHQCIVPRTTLNLEHVVHEELAEYAAARGQSIGAAASYLLGLALKQEARERKPLAFEWFHKDMGKPLIDMDDWGAVKEHLYAEEEQGYASVPRSRIPAEEIEPYDAR